MKSALKVGLAAVLVMSFCLPVHAQSHTVQAGDTLGTIARSQLKSPPRLYGPLGRITRLLEMNPKIKDQNLIFPGDIIYLSQVPENVARDVAQNSQPGEAAPQLELSPTPKVFDKDLRLIVSLTPLFMRMDSIDRSTNAKAVFVSDLLIGFNIGLSETLAERHELSLTYSNQKNKFQRLASGQSFLNTPSTNALEFNYHYLAGSRLTIGAGTGIMQRLYPYAISNTQYTFDVPQIPFWQLDASYLLYKFERTDLGVTYQHLFLSSTSSSNQKIENGQGQKAKVFLRQRRGDFKLGQELFWLRNKQDSSLVEQNETQLGFGLNLGYSF